MEFDEQLRNELKQKGKRASESKKLNRRKILAVIDATLAVAKRKPEKNSRVNGN